MSFSRISNQQTSQATSTTLPISSTHTSRATSPAFEELPLIPRPTTPIFATRSYTSSLQNQPEPLYIHKVVVAVADKGCQTPDSKFHTIIDSLEPVPSILENHSQHLEFLYSMLTEIKNKLNSKNLQVRSVVFEEEAQTRRKAEVEAKENRNQVTQILRNSEYIKIKNEKLNCMQTSTIVIAVIILLYKIIEEVIENFT